MTPGKRFLPLDPYVHIQPAVKKPDEPFVKRQCRASSPHLFIFGSLSSRSCKRWLGVVTPRCTIVHSASTTSDRTPTTSTPTIGSVSCTHDDLAILDRLHCTWVPWRGKLISGCQDLTAARHCKACSSNPINFNIGTLILNAWSDLSMNVRRWLLKSLPSTTFYRIDAPISMCPVYQHLQGVKVNVECDAYRFRQSCSSLFCVMQKTPFLLGETRLDKDCTTGLL